MRGEGDREVIVFNAVKLRVDGYNQGTENPAGEISGSSGSWNAEGANHRPEPLSQNGPQDYDTVSGERCRVSNVGIHRRGNLYYRRINRKDE